MKIETTIAPRKDGTVTCDIDGTRYVFAPDSMGCLVCDVQDEGHIARLLGITDFFPVEEADMGAARGIIENQANESDPEVDAPVPPLVEIPKAAKGKKK